MSGSVWAAQALTHDSAAQYSPIGTVASSARCLGIASVSCRSIATSAAARWSGASYLDPIVVICRPRAIQDSASLRRPWSAWSQASDAAARRRCQRLARQIRELPRLLVLEHAADIGDIERPPPLQQQMRQFHLPFGALGGRDLVEDATTLLGRTNGVGQPPARSIAGSSPCRVDHDIERLGVVVGTAALGECDVVEPPGVVAADDVLQVVDGHEEAGDLDEGLARQVSDRGEKGLGVAGDEVIPVRRLQGEPGAPSVRSGSVGHGRGQSLGREEGFFGRLAGALVGSGVAQILVDGSTRLETWGDTSHRMVRVSTIVSR